MKKHTCKTCGHIFEYCRGCILSPIPYKEAGYCSKACYEESKTPKVEEVVHVEDVEVVVIDEDTSTSDKEEMVSSFFSDIEEPTQSEINISDDNVMLPQSNTAQYHRKKKNKQKHKESTVNDNEQSNPQNI